MNQSQFNDALLQHELRRLNSSLQELFNVERAQQNQYIQQLSDANQQMSQDKAALYDQIDAEQARATKAENLVGYIRSRVYSELDAVITNDNVRADANEWLTRVIEDAAKTEEERAAAVDAAIAPVVPEPDLPTDDPVAITEGRE